MKMFKFLTALMTVSMGIALGQVDTTKLTFASVQSPTNKFDVIELLPAAATQMCSTSTVSVTRTSGTVLSIANGSSATAPQYFRFGNVSRKLTAAVTATLASGTATGTISVYAYLTANKTLAIGVINPTANSITGASITVAAPGSVTGNTIISNGNLLWTWTVTAGAWDVSGGTQVSVGKDCWIDGFTITNLTGGAVTFTITDSQGTPMEQFKAVPIAANTVVAYSFTTGSFYEGGMQATASAASSLNIKIRGARGL
jgi:hypothetical protein